MNRAQLREQTRRFADMANSSFVSDSELNALIDMYTRELYDVLVAAYGDEYFSKVQWLSVNGFDQTMVGADVPWPNTTLGTYLAAGPTQIVPQNTMTDIGLPYGGCKSSFVLAPDFLRLVRAEFVRGTVSQSTVDIYMGSEDPAESRYPPQYHVITADTYSVPMRRIDTPGGVVLRSNYDWHQGNVYYRLRYGSHRVLSTTGGDPGGTGGNVSETVLVGTVIDFLPTTDKQYAVCLTYVPAARLLDSDDVDLAYPFPEFVVHACAAACIEKERGDSAVQRQLQARVAESIRQLSRTPDAANPPMIAMHGRGARRRGEGFVPWE